MKGIADMSPRAAARITGAFYLLTVLAGLIAEVFISDRLVVSGDAAATAANILSHEPLFRFGFTVYLIEMAAQITMTVLLYGLLKPVSRRIALLSMTLGLVGCTIKTLSRLFYYAPLLALGGASYLRAFNADQVNALSLLLLKINGQGAAMALVFFGFESLLQGYLIFRSTFLPGVLGLVSAIGGLGWLTFLSPPLGLRLFPYVAAFGVLGAVAMMAWLLVFGVNEQRWREQADAAAASIWR